MKVVLTIAGSDSGGGAGIQADLKTFEAHRVFGTTAITSVTAQNTLGVRAVFDLPADMVRAQLDAVFDDFDIAAVKIGMLSNREIIETVSEVLRQRKAGGVVLDPVMVATSGDPLLRNDAVAALTQQLFPLAGIVTPNVPEAEVLAGIAVKDLDSMRRAAAAIHRMSGGAVLVKGGHLRSDEPEMAVDLLFDGGKETLLKAPLLAVEDTHGTGCTLSSAIAANLALGFSLGEAVRRAKTYVHSAIARAPGLGHGHGPLMHGQEANEIS